jgi:uncharacterized protein YajQ (UPF0234 family)
MAKESFSFDIISEADLQEVDNAVNQAQKEMAQRFDFKGSKASIEYNRAEKKIKIVGDDDFKLRAVRDMLNGKLVKRGVSLKMITYKDPESVFGGCLEQSADLAAGIPQDRAKELVKLIKSFDLKVQAQIEGEKVRVSSPKKDDLQVVINHLRKVDFPVALTFCNYR